MTFQEEEYWGKKRIKGDLWTNPTGGRQEGKNGKYDRRFREIVQWNSNTYTTWGVNSMKIVHYSQSLAVGPTSISAPWLHPSLPWP